MRMANASGKVPVSMAPSRLPYWSLSLLFLLDEEADLLGDACFSGPISCRNLKQTLSLGQFIQSDLCPVRKSCRVFRRLGGQFRCGHGDDRAFVAEHARLN